MSAVEEAGALDATSAPNPAAGARKPVVLVIQSHYLPGRKVGGPIRSVEGFVDHLGDEMDIRIVCSDRDVGDEQPYPDVPLDQWTVIGKARVLYLPPRSFTLHRLTRVLRDAEPDTVYLNSLYSPRFTLLPLLAVRRTAPSPTVVLAPRGGLSSSALRIRRTKKRVFLGACRRAGVFRNVVWQASSDAEGADIRATVGSRATIVVAPNLAPRSGSAVRRTSPEKVPGRLRVVFLGRVSPMKNLVTALRLVGRAGGEIELTIAGPVDDRAYWEQCQAEIARLPANVQARAIGFVPHDEVPACLAEHHLLLLPSRSENFGHVIAESLQAGTPVLISDRTPWRGLAAEGAGWDEPLEEPERFVDALRVALALDAEGFAAMSGRARAVAERRIGDPAAVDSHRALFGRRRR